MTPPLALVFVALVGLVSCQAPPRADRSTGESARAEFEAAVREVARDLGEMPTESARASSAGSPCGSSVGSSVRENGRDDAVPASRGVPGSLTPGSLTLRAAVAEALAASPELEQIERRIDAAGAQVAEAAAASWPRLILSQTYGITDNPVFALMHIINQADLTTTTDFNDPGQRQDFQTHLAATWRLYDGGQRGAASAAARASREAESADWEAARDRLIRAVIESYLGFHRARSFEGVMREAVEAAERNVELGRTRLEAGSVLRSDLLRLETRLAESRQNLLRARLRVKKLEAALERLLVRPIRDEEFPDLTAKGEGHFERDERPVGEMVSIALEKRPELRSLQALVDAADQQIRAASGARLPQVDLQAGWQLDTERFDSAEPSWVIGAVASLTLFEGGLTEARVRGARARLREAQARGRQLALDIALEVRQAALSVTEAAENLEVARQRESLATESLSEIRKAYDSGATTVEPLLQAEVAWRGAKVARIAARFDRLVARAALAEAIGEIAQSSLTGSFDSPSRGGSGR